MSHETCDTVGDTRGKHVDNIVEKRVDFNVLLMLSLRANNRGAKLASHSGEYFGGFVARAPMPHLVVAKTVSSATHITTRILRISTLVVTHYVD